MASNMSMYPGGPNLLLGNTTGSNQTVGSSVAPNNSLVFYTRTGLTLLRFLVPTTGYYVIAGAFSGAANSPSSSTDAIYLTNGSGSILSTLYAPVTGTLAMGSSNPLFDQIDFLSAGETVDFLVAGTYSGSGNSLATALMATITTVATPEPTSLLLGLGGLGLLFIRRRFKPVS